MNTKIAGLTFLMMGLTGIQADLYAAGSAAQGPVVLPYDIVEPTAKLAKRYQKQGDCLTATLLNEAILKRDAHDRQALKRMIECDEALTKQEKIEQAKEDPTFILQKEDGVSELPNLIPAEKTNAQQPSKVLDSPIL